MPSVPNTFFQDCLCGLQKKSSEFGFSLITKKIQNEFNFLTSIQRELDFYIPVFDLQVFDEKASYKMPLIAPGDISSYFLNNRTAYFIDNKFDSFCINYFKMRSLRWLIWKSQSPSPTADLH